MRPRLPTPPPATKCVCGHRFAEHVQGGDRHACQHGARPPFTHICACGRFRPKAPVRAARKAATVASAAPKAENSQDAPPTGFSN